MFLFFSAIFRKSDRLSSLTIKNTNDYRGTDWLPISLLTHNAGRFISLEVSNLCNVEFFLPLLRECTTLHSLIVTRADYNDTMIVLIDALPRPLDTLHWRLSSYSNIYDYAGNIRQILLSGC